MSRKGSRKTEAFELMEGHYLVGNQGIYKVQEFLGEGSFGKVAKCTKLGSQERYAIKIIANVQEGKEEFESMKLIQVLDHDENHLMKMYECFSFQNVICLVYEILEESLEDFLYKNECKVTPLTYVRAIAQQMFQALKALKSIGVVHCDIKLDNIMFADKKSLNVKLIDFGLAVEKKELPIGTEIQANPFRAPEVILGLPLDESIDMWALGVSLATVYSGNYPFSEEYTQRTMLHVNGNHVINLDQMTEINRKQFDMYDDDDHKAFIDLFKRMLVVNPQCRITPSQALEHDFITMKHLAGKKCYQDEDVMGDRLLGQRRKTSPVINTVLGKSSSHKCFRAWFTTHPRMFILFLPPYSPFLNPIEESFSAWRWRVYEHWVQGQKSLLRAMDAACEDVTGDQCRGWL
uniref:Protein kinase domain-containing protein n=1 Tax=Oryzias latipes TaxID=8090 RepID=A0A3P9HJY0_ORYLA